MRRLVPAILILLAVLPGAALAADAETVDADALTVESTTPDAGTPGEPTTGATALETTAGAGVESSSTGGVGPTSGDQTTQPADGGRPVLKVFEASPRRFYYGGATVLSYRVNDESSEVTINISVKRPGSTERLTVLRLGRQQTNVLHTVRWRNRHAFAGVLRLRLNARDGSGLPLTTTSAQELGTESVRFISHVFPVRGPFDFGGPDSRFGADRGDHIHAGQDMSAAQGTPLAAIRAGRISYVGYQAGGAGNYVVLDADGEVFDYVYMHLETGSTSVSGGERVRTGQRIARVGSTGASTGPHLHFEIWRGPWFGGGEPIDPLPKLQAWLRQAH